MKHTFKSPFHGTTTKIIIQVDQSGRQYITRGQMDNAERNLCGIKDCKCGSFVRSDEPRPYFYMDWQLAVFDKKPKTHRIYL